MKKSQTLFTNLKQNRLIALLTPKNVNQCVSAYELLEPLGVTLEVAFRSECALAGIKAVIDKYPQALILAGTVLTSKQAEDAINAGVAGVVSPDYIPAVVKTCVERDAMCIPGGLSDAGKQLALKAELYDCTLEELREKYPCQWIYKLFPAVSGTRLNLEITRAWKGPFRDLTIVYTGGITLNNLHELVEHDPEGIFCGSGLTKSVDNPMVMKSEVERWINIIQKTKSDRAMNGKRLTINEGLNAQVVTFGEIMLRLSPPDQRRFIQTDSYNATFGGAEANTAVAFANYGLPSCFVTALPDHEIGEAAVNSLRSYGVDTRYIVRQGSRIGIYFLEHGASQRPSKVIYDRAGSSIAELKPDEINWEVVFQHANWFHWSGITPALSERAAQVTIEALEAANKAGVTISVDLNYRKKLWSRERAGAVLSGLMKYVDICICNEEDAEILFDIKAAATDVESGHLAEEAYRNVGEKLVERFGFKKAAITLRRSLSASENDWSACLYNGGEFLKSRKYRIQIVDRVGAGDSFASGLIYGIITGKSDQEALEFGTAASVLKQTIHGDYNLVSIAEVEQLAAGKTAGRIQR